MRENLKRYPRTPAEFRRQAEKGFARANGSPEGLTFEWAFGPKARDLAHRPDRVHGSRHGVGPRLPPDGFQRERHPRRA
jgi:hypothetical protein